MTVIGRLVGTALIIFALASPAAGQGFKCDYAPAIVSLSNTVLSKRTGLSMFQRRNAGAAEASYLAINYTPLGDHEAEALLASLIEDGARGVDEVTFAWSYGMSGGEVTERLLGPNAVAEMVSVGSISAIRAMIREGDEEKLMATLAELPETGKVSAFTALAVAILDYSNDWKRQLAGQALDRSMPELAAALVAIDGKGEKAWNAFTTQLGDPALVTRLTQRWSWVPAMVGNPELPRTPEQEPLSDPAQRAKLHDMLITAAMTPQVDFLMTLLNQSGKVDETVPASEALRAAIESGEIARDGTYGPAWLLAYRVLNSSWEDRDQLRSTLGSFQVTTPQGGRSPLELLDALIAIEALTPYLKGETDDLPEVPAELSPDFAAWPQWLEVAAKVKASPTDPSLRDEAVLPIAAELLLAAGEIDALAATIAAATATSPVLHLAVDITVRLDRMCSSYLYHPSEAVQLVGRPLYKFDG